MPRQGRLFSNPAAIDLCLGNAKYFLNLEKRKNADRTLNTIIAGDGTCLTDIHNILQEGKLFYEQLYKSDEDSLLPADQIDRQIQNLQLPQLSCEDRDSLEAPFSREELKSALSHLNTGKCPGTDGIPPEFYSRFWDLLAPFFCTALDYSLDWGTMLVSQRRGIITLLPKKDTDKRFIANWRLTLLNTDYKIYTKPICLRLQRVMGLLINPNRFQEEQDNRRRHLQH